MKKSLLSVILLGLLLVACTTASPAEETESPAVEPVVETASDPTPEPEMTTLEENITAGCVDAYSEGVDYFPNKIEVTEAANFTVDYFDHYKVVTINAPFAGAESGITYLLVQCGTPIPADVTAEATIEVPVNSIVAMSTSYLPALEELGLLDKVVGVDTAAFTSNETITSGVAAGDIVEIGGGAEVNVETAIDLQPDLIMTYGTGSADFDAEPRLREAGLDVALNAEFLETTPLGRAEWVDYIALFFNEEAAAESWFEGVADRYNELRDMAAGTAERPVVFTDTPYEGTWYMAGGGSFAAQLLEDAGADYVYADDEQTGSLFLDFETVFDDASAADFWLNIGFFSSLDDLSAADSRFTEFTAFQNGQVYNNDARMSANGGNDYYESAVVRPDVVLEDLIAIFHPDLVPAHEFTYFRKVE